MTCQLAWCLLSLWPVRLLSAPVVIMMKHGGTHLQLYHLRVAHAFADCTLTIPARLQC